MGCHTGHRGREWRWVQKAVERRHKPGMCNRPPPHLLFNGLNADMKRIHADVLSLQFQTSRDIMAIDIISSLLLVGILLPEPNYHPALILWCEREPIPLCYSATSAPPTLNSDCSMTRPRGRPRRGAPWRPRRPPLSSPDSSSDNSLPLLRSASSQVTLHPPQPGSMAIIPSTSIMLRRPLHDPGPSQPLDSTSSLGQASQQIPNSPALDGPASMDTAQCRDNVATLYSTAFELQQEVTDFHHRVEAMEIKVTNLLQLLASMHEALCPNSEGEAVAGDPEGEETHPPGERRNAKAQENMAELAESNQWHDAHGDDGLLDDAKAPGLGDPPAT